MVLAMAMWAFIENIPEHFSQHYTSFQIVWLRYTVHLLFMLVVFGPRVKLGLVRTRHLGLQFGRGMLMMGMHLCFIFAVGFLPVNATLSVFWVTPLLLLGLSAWRAEKADGVQWAVTAGGVACVLLLLRPLGAALHPASLLSLGMALCFSIYMQMTRAMRDEGLLPSLFYTALSVWLVLSVLMPFFWVTPSAWDLLLFAAIGLLGFVCLVGFDKAAELAPTWVTAPFSLVQPLFILAINWGLRGINPGRLGLAAVGLLLAAFGFLLWRKSPLPAHHGKAHV